MRHVRCFAFWLRTACLCAALSHAAPVPANDVAPQAYRRSNEQNYRDRALALCLASAYAKEPATAADAGNTASVLVEWLDYDADRSPKELAALIKTYLARDYQYPLPDLYQGVQFRLLKCLDLYHSQELADQVKRNVTKSKRK